jgi:hypothetical protein
MMISIGSRACCRCWKDLTDAASMEVGVGPICRKLDNAILARKIPSNVAAAQAAAGRVVDADLPEPVRPTYGQVMADLMDFSTVDWRKTVKRIEWILSWGMTDTMRKALIEIVRSLGYIGLAALLSGEAATGATVVTFENGRLYLRGPRNKAGAYQIKKLIPGWKFVPAVGGSKAAWTVPAAAAEKFATIAITYWVNISGIDEAVEAAKAAPVAAVESAPAKAGPNVTISAPTNGWMKVASPFNAEFVIAIKKLPHPSRKWNVVEKVWEVEAKFLADVQTMVQTYFKVAAVVSAAA